MNTDTSNVQTTTWNSQRATNVENSVSLDISQYPTQSFSLDQTSNPLKKSKSSKGKASQEQPIEPGIVQKLKLFYKLKGWSLVFPTLVSLFIALYEGAVNPRSLAYCFIAVTCLCSYVFLKSLNPKKNLLFIGLITFSFGVVFLDFLVQFGVLGPDGWRKTSLYTSCFQKLNTNNYEEIHVFLCKGFKLLYYFNVVIYFSTISCFLTFIYASTHLLLMTKYVGDGGGFLVKLEDQIEEDD